VCATGVWLKAIATQAGAVTAVALADAEKVLALDVLSFGDDSLPARRGREYA
jgi:hypothetical protein